MCVVTATFCSLVYQYEGHRYKSHKQQQSHADAHADDGDGGSWRQKPYRTGTDAV